jgi:hypothetical protein
VSALKEPTALPAESVIGTQLVDPSALASNCRAAAVHAAGAKKPSTAVSRKFTALEVLAPLAIVAVNDVRSLVSIIFP